MKNLIKATEELNEILGTKIPTKKITEEELIAQLEEAAALLEVDDAVTPATTKTLKDIDVWPFEEDADAEVEEEEEVKEEEVEEAPAPVKKGKAKPAPVVEEVEEEEEVVEKEDDTFLDYSALIADIKATSKLVLKERVVALKEIVMENAIFAPMVKTVAGKFNAEDLRTAMMELLVKAELKGVAPKEGKKVVKQEKPAKAEKTVKAVKEKPVKDPNAPKKPAFGRVAGAESNQELANRLMDENASDAVFTKEFTKVYASKGVDAAFVAKRIKIYKDIAKKAGH